MKEKMIKRTITQTTGIALFKHVETGEVAYIEHTIGGDYTITTLLLKFRKLFDTDDFKVSEIISMESKTVTIEMSLSDFIKYGIVVSEK